jgi:hypothetical protein
VIEERHFEPTRSTKQENKEQIQIITKDVQIAKGMEETLAAHI